MAAESFTGSSIPSGANGICWARAQGAATRHKHATRIAFNARSLSPEVDCQAQEQVAPQRLVDSRKGVAAANSERQAGAADQRWILVSDVVHAGAQRVLVEQPPTCSQIDVIERRQPDVRRRSRSRVILRPQLHCTDVIPAER